MTEPTVNWDFNQSVNDAIKGFTNSDFGHFVGSFFQKPQASSISKNTSVPKPSLPVTQNPTPSPLPGQMDWIKDHPTILKYHTPQEAGELYKKAVNSPGGHYYQSAPTPTSPSVKNPQNVSSNQPDITIPYSQGGQRTLHPEISQILLNAFNDINQATNSAQVLNHPKQITAIGNEQERGINNGPNYGENASFKTKNIDIPNPDGSIDRGLFRINNNTFNGMMKDPYWGNVAREKFGINSWDDMEDPQKNAYMARLIYERGGWGRWFAAPQALRAQGAPDLAKLSQLLTRR